MPIHDVGYRSWQGVLMSLLTRWWVITEAGIRINFKNSWVRRTLLLAWLPVFGAGVGIFTAEKMLEAWQSNDDLYVVLSNNFQDWARTFQNFEPVLAALESGDRDAARAALWSWIILNFLRFFQGATMVLLLGLIVPPLIAQDMRSRAFQLYYARPIGRFDYILGKFAIPAFFVVLITTAPALGLYAFGVAMSPDLTVLYDTWQIPVQILAATAVMIIPTCSLALMFSSLTHESRFAAFAWFSVWGLGLVAWNMIQAIEISQLDPGQRVESNWTLVSLYDTLIKVQSYVFGLETRFGYVAPSFVLLGIITLFSILILLRRVSAPLRA